MPRVISYFVVVAFLILSGQGASAANHDEMRALVSAYNAGDVAVALQHAHELLASRPDDATAHYYLGNCYLKLGKRPEAIAAYRACLTLHADPVLISYVHQALAALEANGVKALDLQRQVEHNHQAAADEAKRQVAAMDEQIEHLRRKRIESEDRIRRIQANAKLDVAEVPRLCYGSVGYRYRSGGLLYRRRLGCYNANDSSYRSAVAEIEVDAGQKIAKENREIRDIDTQIERLTVARDSLRNFSGGNTSLAPSNQAHYVREYTTTGWHPPPLETLRSSGLH